MSSVLQAEFGEIGWPFATVEDGRPAQQCKWDEGTWGVHANEGKVVQGQCKWRGRRDVLAKGLVGACHAWKKRCGAVFGDLSNCVGL